MAKMKNGEVLVSSRQHDGVRVYPASNPRNGFTVRGTATEPTCECPQFQFNNSCEHIAAASHLLPNVQHKAEPQTKQAMMRVKRSVSPDGKINSLSIEFDIDISGLLASEIRQKTENSLALQTAIVQQFMSTCNHRAPNTSTAPVASASRLDYGSKNASANGANRHGEKITPTGQTSAQSGQYLEARLVSVAAQETKYGWKPYILVEANGKLMKLFGSQKQLGYYLRSAGYPERTRELAEGTELNLPCMVVLKSDGRYEKIDKVFPFQTGRGN